MAKRRNEEGGTAVMEREEATTEAQATRQPRVGDWVHFVVNKDMPQYAACAEFTGFVQHFAAMIAWVYEDGSVFLHVHAPKMQMPNHVPKAIQDPTGQTPWTWHFAE